MASSSFPVPLLRPAASDPSSHNVGETERVASVVAGGLLALYGLSRRSLGGLALAGLGGALAYRGTTGHCPAYSALGVSTADSASAPPPVEIAESVTVTTPRAEVYAFWRKLENLPRFMHHLESVRELGDGRSRWKAKGPGPLPDVAWLAEITEERENEVLAWRSLPGADVENTGEVRFNDGPNGSTEVHVRIAYRPPAGAAGAAVAKRLDAVFGQLVRNDVRRFQQVLEAGEVITTDGQPSGRAEG